MGCGSSKQKRKQIPELIRVEIISPKKAEIKQEV